MTEQGALTAFANPLEALSVAVDMLRMARPNGHRGWDLPTVDEATELAEVALGEMRRRCYRPEPLLKGGWGTRAW